MKSDQFFSGDQYFPPTNNFTRLKLTPTKNFYQLFFLLNKDQIMEILKKNYQIYYTIIWLSGVGWGRVVKKGKFKMKRKMSHVVASCLKKKHVLQSNFLERVLNFFYHNTVIPAPLKPFIAISLSPLRVLYRSTIHFACRDLTTESLRETLTFAAAFPALNYFDTSLASQELYLPEIKDLAALLTLMSNG